MHFYTQKDEPKPNQLLNPHYHHVATIAADLMGEMTVHSEKEVVMY